MPRVPTILANKEIGARFAWVRDHLNERPVSPGRPIFQSAAAKILGCHVTHLCRVEKGTKPFSRDFAVKFCSSFGVNHDWLMTGDGSPWESSSPSSRVAEECVTSPPNGHGRNEICREIVMAAVTQTLEAIEDRDMMRLVTEIGEKTGTAKGEVLGMLIWNKVKETPRT